MRARDRQSQRILTVQRQLHRIEQWKMAELEQRLADLDATQRDLISALNEDHALHGLFLDTMARRLKSLAEEADRVMPLKQAQSLVLLAQAVRSRLAERLARAARQDLERETERKELLEIVDQFLRSAAQASGKPAEG